jgi:hypothetical protein
LYWFYSANSKELCTTHGGGALHGKPHKFCGAIYKTFIFNFEVGRFALTTMFIALNDTLNFKS